MVNGGESSFSVRQASTSSAPNAADRGMGDVWARATPTGMPARIVERGSRGSESDGVGEPLLVHSPARGAKSVEDRAATGTVWGSIVNLAATSMGAGVLSLPIALKYGGWVLGTALLAAFALLCDLSLLLLVRARRVSGKASLDDIAEHFYGRVGRAVVKASLITMLFGASVVLLIIGSELLTPVLQYLLLGGGVYSSDCAGVCDGVAVPWWAGTLQCSTCALPPVWLSKVAVSVGVTALVLPLTLARHLSALSVTSTAAVLAILLVGVAVVVKFGIAGPAASVSALTVRPDMFLGASIQGIAFCNQFNIVGVYDELPPAKRDRLPTIIHASMLGVVFPVYAAAGLAGYLMFGSAIPPNILNAFASTDKVMMAASIAVALTNVLKVGFAACRARRRGATSTASP